MPKPSRHTMLINSAIGFCVKDDSWIHPLADLKYKAQLVEQTISSETSDMKVQPDVVATSKKLNHSIIIECKGEQTLNELQISKYNDLMPADIIRWISVHDPSQHTHDICLLIYKVNKAKFLAVATIPVLVLSDISLEKFNQFSQKQLNQKFNELIPIADLIPPISYYPFSEIDDRRVIVPHALRVVQLIMNTGTDQTDTFNPESRVNDAVMKKIFRVWDIISRKQQNALKSKIIKIIKELLRSYPDLKSFVESTPTIEKNNTAKLVSFGNICNKIQQAEMRSTLDDFPK